MMEYLPELHRLEHQLDLAQRAVRLIADKETVERLEAFAQDIGDRLRTLQAAAREEAIRKRAYELWLSAGRPGGRDLEFWLSAEREFLQGHNLPIPVYHR
ncbi:DUF2934 domain-containing protein [Bradyrhizobium sp. SEMIA]|uniref:DUF2934 domain-containing protein n=2 Tax=Nitrobacteraceae TaxID=41294 RepID=UPI000689061D|nr:DUF2934 domain-containing protein [Bradyrhizobium sp. SEMIA]QOG16364.1 DUF2934 domain-containing protein [Bradyrhizobium sp. SEMIA]